MSSFEQDSTAGAGHAPAAPFARVLCAVNGSRPSQEAVRQAIALAGPRATVRFLAVCDLHGVGPTRTALLGEKRAAEALDAARRTAEEDGVRADVELRHDTDPRRAILEAARSHDVLVLGSHGHSRAEAMLVGGTAALALHACSVPVLVARSLPHYRALGEHVLVATDGSPWLRAAARVAATIAARDAGHVMLLHVEDGDARAHRHELAEEAADVIEVIGVEPVVLTAEGRPVDAILRVAASERASLIVLGSRTLTGVHALASVSERVGNRAPCSVLVLRGPT